MHFLLLLYELITGTRIQLIVTKLSGPTRAAWFILLDLTGTRLPWPDSLFTSVEDVSLKGQLQLLNLGFLRSRYLHR